MANRNQEREAQQSGTRQNAPRRGQEAQAGSVEGPGMGTGSPDQQRSVQTSREGAGMTRQGQRNAYPFGMMSRMLEDMDRMFSGFGLIPIGRTPVRRGDRERESGDGMPTLWAPEIELLRRKNDLIVRADLPGLKKEDVHIEIEHDVLTISGERRHEFEEETDGVYRTERSYGSFYRAIPLPDGTDADDVKASFQDGVLEIRLKLPKEQQRKSRRIDIG